MHDLDPALPASSPETSVLRALAHGVSEFFTLRSRLAQANLGALQPSDSGFHACRAGLLALKDAHQLGNSRAGRETALLLYRSVIRLLAGAAVQRSLRGESSELSWSETWSRAAGLTEWVGAPGVVDEEPPAWLVEGVVSEEGELYLAKLRAADAERALLGMRGLAQRLAEPLEDDFLRVRRLIWLRRLRLLVAGLLAFCALFAVLDRLASRRNLALHRPVVVSDREPTYGVNPSQLVDGDELNLGFHTTNSANTSATIDLGALQALHRIEIFNRADCCQDRVTPIAVQLSNDGLHYRAVARRTRIFQQWVLPLPSGTSARFVRLVHESHDFFHLSEVKVY